MPRLQADVPFTDSKIPYEYFSCLAELNVMKSQPLLSRVEIIGRLWSKELVDTLRCDLSVGLFQHFDFFNSNTINNYSPNSLEPCVAPYKLGTPASVGGILQVLHPKRQWFRCGLVCHAGRKAGHFLPLGGAAHLQADKIFVTYRQIQPL